MEINRLRAQLSGQHMGPNFEEKYKKSLKEIAAIIQLNNQLKIELDKLKYGRRDDVENLANIQKEEFDKAYDKLLK